MSQPGNDALPDRLAKKLARVCVRPGCDAEVDDADECPPHHEESKRHKRESAARKRDDRRRRKQCIDCGRKAKRRRCPSCYRKSRGVEKSVRGVEKRAALWREDPGTSWNRYRGKGRRGRLTREAQIDEDIRDAGFAVAEVRKFIEEIEGLKDPSVPGMPPIQREALKRKAGSFAAYAARILDDLADKYGSTKG